MTDYVRCLRCDSILLEPCNLKERERCPECGSTKREISVDVANQFDFHEMLGTKQKRPNEKPFLMTKSGGEFFRKTGEWHEVVRVIDRDNDRYCELIKNEQGEVVRHVDEPLSEHYGRGSAKLQNHNLPEEQIAVAAYFIWESEGCPDGRDYDHWAMGIENLKRLRAGIALAY